MGKHCYLVLRICLSLQLNSFKYEAWFQELWVQVGIVIVSRQYCSHVHGLRENELMEINISHRTERKSRQDK